LIVALADSGAKGGRAFTGSLWASARSPRLAAASRASAAFGELA